MVLELLEIKTGLHFYVAVKYSLQISSVLSKYIYGQLRFAGHIYTLVLLYQKWQLSMVLTDAMFCYNSAKYEANFVIIFPLLLEMI